MEIIGSIITTNIEADLIEVILDDVSEMKSVFISKESCNKGEIELCSDCRITIFKLTKQGNNIYFIDEYSVSKIIEEGEIDFDEIGEYYYHFFVNDDGNISFLVKSDLMITLSNLNEFNLILCNELSHTKLDLSAIKIEKEVFDSNDANLDLYYFQNKKIVHSNTF